MGPISSQTGSKDVYRVDGPPGVFWLNHRKVTVPRVIYTRHGRCRDTWRCSGPGCVLRTGKTEHSYKRSQAKPPATYKVYPAHG